MKKQFDTSIKFALMLMVALLCAACGNKDTTPTTIPTSETIFYMHNLVFNGSTLLSTGYNGFGQLGTGNLADRTSLGSISGLPVSTVGGAATGGVHSVAFYNNSTVRSWGSNIYGQLGNGTTTYSSVPVKTINLGNIIAVAAGADHTLALRSDDTLWAWGRDNYGQLGYYPGSPSNSAVPQHIGVGIFSNNSAHKPFANISSIAANGYHSLARANGLVWAWGYNGTGQLGRNALTVPSSSIPTVIDSLTPGGVIAIAAGGGFSCAVAKNGTVWAWGYNALGQLGANHNLDSYVPLQVMKIDGTPLTGVVQVVAGLQHVLARLGDGTVWAWGYNAFGQLGTNSKLDSWGARQVVSDAGGTPFTGATDIRAFGSSSMAKKDGAWYAWGDNAYGQLGVGSKSTQYYPVKMSGF